MKLHNHFAGLLEMILPLALGLALYYAQKSRVRSRRGSWREFQTRLANPEMLKCLLLLLAVTVLFLGIVFSFSRMGLISMFASLAVMGAVLWIGRHRNPLPTALIPVLLFSAISAAVWVGAGPVVSHFEELSHDDPLDRGTEGRMAIWNDSIELIRQNPWTGAGLGCFEIAFTRVQSVELSYTMDHAHNDYLELVAELGIPAAALLFIALFALAALTVQAALRARSGLARAHALGALGGITALLVHSLADFNLHIPANALVFSVLLGLGTAISAEGFASGELEFIPGATEVLPKPELRRHLADAKSCDGDEVRAGVKDSRSS